MNKPTDFAYYLSKYLCNYLPETKGVSSDTLKTYTTAFKIFFQYMKDEKSISTEKVTLEMITETEIREFLDWIETARGCSINTRNQRLNTMRSFFRFIENEAPQHMYQCQKIRAIPKKKAPKNVIDYLSTEGIRLLLDTPDESTYEGRKHAVLLTLTYAAGARVSEIIKLKISDFKYNGSNLIKLTGKGSKSRLVPLEPPVVQLMEQYLAEQKDRRETCKTSDFMFLNHSNRQLTRQGVTHILKKYIQLANRENADLVPLSISVHGLRHSRAVHWLQAGIDLIYIRDLLGHSSIQTTEIYIRIDNEQKAKALKNLSPENYPGEEKFIWHEDKDLLDWLKSFSQ